MAVRLLKLLGSLTAIQCRYDRIRRGMYYVYANKSVQEDKMILEWLALGKLTPQFSPLLHKSIHFEGRPTAASAAEESSFKGPRYVNMWRSLAAIAITTLKREGFNYAPSSSASHGGYSRAALRGENLYKGSFACPLEVSGCEVKRVLRTTTTTIQTLRTAW